MKRILSFIFRYLTAAIAIPILYIYCYFLKKRPEKPRLFWGPVPILNNSYWARAMKEGGYDSKTVMKEFFEINKKSDFDLYYDDFYPYESKFFRKFFKYLLPYYIFAWCVKSFDIFHLPFNLGLLETTPLKNQESYFLKLAGCKIVCLPYGADAYVYDEVSDLSLRHALLTSYPEPSKSSELVKKDILFWTKHADAIVQGLMVDSFPRWDVLFGNFISIDVDRWKVTSRIQKYDGINGSVKISHTPNHRGCKGTEFLMNAINRLRDEGLKIELILFEKRKNDEVRELLQTEVDIHCDQLIIPGYGLSGIEGMACGLPVISNLDNDQYLQVFRRFSFLGKCPIASATPETIYEKLKLLVTDPCFREELGEKSRKFVETYHSFECSRYLFESIYKKIWYGEEVDLISLFHPLKSKYPKEKIIIQNEDHTKYKISVEVGS